MKEDNKIILKKGDMFLLLFACILFLVLVVFSRLRNQGQYVYITVAGEKKTYSLLENQTIIIEHKADNKNVLVVEDGHIYMKSADCPDQTCVKHKSISKDGELIICLPNEVFVEVDSNEQGDIDN